MDMVQFVFACMTLNDDIEEVDRGGTFSPRIEKKKPTPMTQIVPDLTRVDLTKPTLCCSEENIDDLIWSNIWKDPTLDTSYKLSLLLPFSIS